MVASDGPMGLSLPGVARIVKQCRPPKVLKGIFKLHRSFTVKELRRDDGFQRI
jgi:hypothetical protein